MWDCSLLENSVELPFCWEPKRIMTRAPLGLGPVISTARRLNKLDWQSALSFIFALPLLQITQTHPPPLSSQRRARSSQRAPRARQTSFCFHMVLSPLSAELLSLLSSCALFTHFCKTLKTWREDVILRSQMAQTALGQTREHNYMINICPRCWTRTI